MIAEMDILITKAERSKLQDLNLDNLPFGRYFSDHMLEADFENGEWKNAEIKPYQPLLMNPSVAAIHYGQAIFEGIKAYRDRKGNALGVQLGSGVHRNFCSGVLGGVGSDHA